MKFPGRTVRGWQEAAAILRLAGVVACMGTGGGVQVSDHFRAILGCLLSETWTTPTLVELVSTPDGHLLGRCDGEAASRVFLGNSEDLLRNIHGVAIVAELDGDEIGYLLGRIAKIRRG
ncbi:MAG: hypothetical protein ACK524_22880 [Planctomyces sp.]